MDDKIFIGSVSLERIRRYIKYNAKTGALTWRKNRVDGCGRVVAHKGARAGSPGRRYMLSINGNPLQGSSVAWALHYGKNPIGTLRFLDGNPLNLKIDNLFDTGTVKKCKKCSEEKILSAFRKSEKHSKGRAIYCLECEQVKYDNKEPIIYKHKFMPPIVRRSLGIE